MRHAGKIMGRTTELHHSKILAALHTAGKLRGRALVAAIRLASDCAASHGSSVGVVANYGDAGNGGSGDGPAYYVSASAQRLDALSRHLHPHERDLLGELLRVETRPWPTIQSWGASAGYRSDDAQRAAGVARVLALLASVADFYGFVEVKKEGARNESTKQVPQR